MTFTAAGQALAARVPAMLAGWDQALREAKTADSQAAQVLRVGFLAGAANEATQQIIAAFAHRRPGWRVEMRASRGDTNPVTQVFVRCCLDNKPPHDPENPT